jgi:hypothetical protein
VDTLDGGSGEKRNYIVKNSEKALVPAELRAFTVNLYVSPKVNPSVTVYDRFVTVASYSVLPSLVMYK